MRIRIAAIAVLVSVGICLAGCSSLMSGAARQRGPKFVLQVDPKPGDQWPSSAEERAAVLDKAREVLEKRPVPASSGAALAVTVEGNDKLIVELPVGTSKAQAKQFAASGSLEFYYLNDVQNQVNPLGKWKMDISGTDGRNYTFTGPKGETLNTAKPADMQKILTQVVGVPSVRPVLTGADLLSNAKSAITPTSTRPIIEIEFSRRGAELFSDFTRSHVNEIVAIFYDGKLLTAPKINAPITDGKAIVQGFKSLREATEVASAINAGALPVHLKVIDAPKSH